jgi:hypothetical protein
VALNAARAAEEKAGLIRWLRPDYQIPKFGSDAEQARLKADRMAVKTGELPFVGSPATKIRKPKFPTDDELDENDAVRHVLAMATIPLSVSDIAANFFGTTRNEKRVTLIILAMARLGRIGTADGGQTFMLRRSG